MGEGPLPWMGAGVPTLNRGGTYLGQVMPRAAFLLQFPAGTLSCTIIVFILFTPQFICYHLNINNLAIILPVKPVIIEFFSIFQYE